MLNPLQNDLLVELLNTQIGIAASLLSEMVNQKIILSVPQIKLEKGSDFNLQEFDYEGNFSSEDAIMSSIKFGNAFKGSAYVVFPIKKAKIFSNACMGIQVSEDELTRLTDEDFDVIKEICNILLNSVVGEFGNLLDVKLVYEAPEMKFSTISSLNQNEIIPNNIYVLVLYTSFFLSESQVNGLILVALSVDSVDLLICKIDEMLRGLDD